MKRRRMLAPDAIADAGATLQNTKEEPGSESFGARMISNAGWIANGGRMAFTYHLDLSGLLIQEIFIFFYWPISSAPEFLCSLRKIVYGRDWRNSEQDLDALACFCRFREIFSTLPYPPFTPEWMRQPWKCRFGCHDGRKLPDLPKSDRNSRGNPSFDLFHSFRMSLNSFTL